MPARKAILPPESFLDLSFPIRGIDISGAFAAQRKQTTPAGVNVRAMDPATRRLRGAQRPGLVRYINARVNGTSLIQELANIVGAGYTAPGSGGVQTSQSGRVVTLVAVSQGTVFVANAGNTAWSSTTNNGGTTPPLNATGVVLSAPNQQKLYFADGTHYRYYDPSTNSVEVWAASAGTLPTDSGSNKPRLICTWRGRTVVSGLLKDPQNWFMSKVDDPTNFDYSPASTTPTQAIAGNNSPAGQVGDVITALVPYTDDILIFGGDHTLWMMRGDPMQGGQIDLVSDAIGMAFGVPWCKDPYGGVYFVSNRCGIYTLVPGQQPQRISQAIEQIIGDFDTGASTIRLIWDDRFQGLHVFVTPTAAAGDATHFFYEQRVGAWWQDVFGNDNHNPLTVCVFDGNEAADRVPLIGSWDGYVRTLDPDATKDDGTVIASEVILGPLLTKDLDEVMLKDLQAVLATASGDVSFAVHVGQTAEGALTDDPVLEGTWQAGRNLSNFVRRSGYAVYVKITASVPWALEQVRARVVALGKVRRRGR